MGKKKIKLHVGCGKVYKKGWINIDAYDLSCADLQALAHRLPYGNNSVDAILSSHLIEHLTRREFNKTLSEWWRVLKRGGCLKIETPDLIKNIKIFLKSTYLERWENYSREFKYGRIQTIYGLDSPKGLAHRYGFDRERLKKLLKEKGFVNIKISSKKGTPIQGENIVAVCEKPKKKGREETGIEKIEIRNSTEELGKIRGILRFIKSKTVYLLRYLADTINDLGYPKFH